MDVKSKGAKQRRLHAARNGYCQSEVDFTCARHQSSDWEASLTVSKSTRRHNTCSRRVLRGQVLFAGLRWEGMCACVSFSRDIVVE